MVENSMRSDCACGGAAAARRRRDEQRRDWQRGRSDASA